MREHLIAFIKAVIADAAPAGRELFELYDGPPASAAVRGVWFGHGYFNPGRVLYRTRAGEEELSPEEAVDKFLSPDN